MLARLPVPIRCEDCDNTAYWAWDQESICYAHMRGMADLNSTNESALYEALIMPVLVPPIATSGADIEMIIHESTREMAICQVLNFLPYDQVIGIELQVIHTGKMTRGGRGFYSLDTCTFKCHAPTINILEESEGMIGWASRLNAYSHKIREYVGQEFQELEESR